MNIPADPMALNHKTDKGSTVVKLVSHDKQYPHKFTIYICKCKIDHKDSEIRVRKGYPILFLAGHEKQTRCSVIVRLLSHSNNSWDHTTRVMALPLRLENRQGYLFFLVRINTDFSEVAGTKM